MAGLLPDVDPQGLLEFSVVYTDRALNHMSQKFQAVMRDISATLRMVYGAHAVAVVPGSGTFGMEAVARQFATGRRCLVLRNGWFSYRWSQILEVGGMARETRVAQARRLAEQTRAPWVPAPLEEVCAAIDEFRPEVVFAPHVETASGMILPEEYLRTVAAATHAAGGLFVLDCIASGAVWVDMPAVGIDVLISAPQKGWSAEPGCALVMFSPAAEARLADTQSSSFACDLKKWRQIMAAFENGGHAYHATMPTGTLARLRDAMLEMRAEGFGRLRVAQWTLGDEVRGLLAACGLPSVAAAGFEAPGVVVCYTDDVGLHDASKFAAVGLQTAAGVPLQCGEPADFRTFRIGLFGLDKLRHVQTTVGHLREALERLGLSKG